MALAAIFGVQQLNGVVDDVPAVEPVADSADSYTVPDQVEQLREYYLRHNASASHLGAERFNARLVTLELRDGVLVEIEAPESEQDGEVSRPTP